MSRDIAIWWLNQQECEAIGDRLPKKMPVYLRDQYRSRYGRPGRGRLWVDEQFGQVSIDPWPQTATALLLTEGYGGIVLHSHDLEWLRDLPGLVTDLKLQRYHCEG